MLVLGLETSCDETGVALYDTERGLLAHRVYSQIAVHAEYGGVVPELASRDHIRKIGLLVNQAVEEASIRLQDLDGVAYTAGYSSVPVLGVLWPGLWVFRRWVFITWKGTCLPLC